MSKKQETETTTAVAEVPKSELATTNASGLEISSTDIDVPRVNIVQKTSEIEAPLGAVVLDKQHVLAEADEAISVLFSLRVGARTSTMTATRSQTAYAGRGRSNQSVL